MLSLDLRQSFPEQGESKSACERAMTKAHMAALTLTLRELSLPSLFPEPPSSRARRLPVTLPVPPRVPSPVRAHCPDMDSDPPPEFGRLWLDRPLRIAVGRCLVLRSVFCFNIFIVVK